MCFSAMYYIQRNLEEGQSETKVDWTNFEYHFLWRNLAASTVKIPSGLENWAYENAPDNLLGQNIRSSIDQFHLDEEKREAQLLSQVSDELQVLDKKMATKPTKTAEKSLQAKKRKLEKLEGKRLSRIKMRQKGADRIYPNWMAPVEKLVDGVSKLQLMRYRVLPANGKEIPMKYNVFNARRDSLTNRHTWQQLFGKNHALFHFRYFYEWVERDGKSVELQFQPREFEFMSAPVLFSQTKINDHWLQSFAMVTDEPPPEVLAAGHDRCPVFLTKQAANSWMHPENLSLDDLDKLLEQKQSTYFEHSQAA